MPVSFINSASANQTGTILTTTSAASSVPGAISEADQWRVTANTSIASSSTVISANWERSDSSGAGYIGTGMTQSSGVFTFPTTGTWYIRGFGQPSIDGSNRYNSLIMQVTVNNSTYTDIANGTAFISRTNANFTVGYCSCEYIFNVTNTTNCKVRFIQYGESAQGAWNGDTNVNTTGAIFMRLGAST